MKENFLEYLNELIYMLKTYENNWWVNYVDDAYQAYYNNNQISKYTSLFGGMGRFNDIGFNNKVTKVLQDITYEMAHLLEKDNSFNLNSILSELFISYSNNDLQSEYNYTKYLLENYSQGNLHEINLAYLNQFQKKSKLCRIFNKKLR